MENLSPRTRIIIIVVGLLAIIAIIIASIVSYINASNQNQFGNYIKIQNYDQKIKNISSDIKDSTEANLYSIVKKNTSADFTPSSIGDAYIRESSDSQTYNNTADQYVGKYIVDIESLKQSYSVQYNYSKTKLTATEGNAVVISCVSEDDLKFGEFNCVDSSSVKNERNDPILSYLPHQNLSFKITPDTSGEDKKLILRVILTIPQSDLKGSAESSAEIIRLYKKEVTDWVISKGLDPTKYTFSYNY